MRSLKLLRLLPILFLAFLMVFPTVHASSFPIQIIGQQSGSCSNPAVCQDIAGVNTGSAAGNTFAQDSNGNLIALFACSNFSNCGGNSHFGFLAWSNNAGVTWNNCGFGSGVCTNPTPQTTHVMQNPGSTCIHSGAMYVSGSTVDVAYQSSAVNGVANFYVDRFTITYSGTAISTIDNNGAETAATGINDQTTSGFSCVQQILPTPNGGGEIMVFAVEENSGPIYMFRTGVTTSAFKNLAGTASAVSSTVVSQSDGSNSCSQFQPATGDIWNMDVYDRTGGTVFVNVYPYNSGTGNWGTVGSTNVGGQLGVPLLTKSLACTVDPVGKVIYWSWFNCTTSGNVVCGTGAPVAGNTCRWELYDATSSSVGAPNPIITALTTLTDSAGKCHESQNSAQVGGGGSLTFVNNQLFLTGTDDNLFGSGCSSEGGSDDTKCQQLFLAKYTITTPSTGAGTWGSMTQYTGNPSAVMGEGTFASGSNYYLLYSTCNNYSGAGNGNDGACGAATGNSLMYDPIIIPPPVPPTLCSTETNGAVLGAEGIFVVLALIAMGVVQQANAGNLNPEEAKAALRIVVILAIAVLIVAILAGLTQAGGPC